MLRWILTRSREMPREASKLICTYPLVELIEFFQTLDHFIPYFIEKIDNDDYKFLIKNEKFRQAIFSNASNIVSVSVTTDALD